MASVLEYQQAVWASAIATPSKDTASNLEEQKKKAAAPQHAEAEVNIKMLLLAVVGVYIVIYLLHVVERIAK